MCRNGSKREKYGIRMTTKIKSDNREIYPIPDLASVAKIRKILRGKPRDLLLFDLAIQTGMGINRLIGLKVKDLLDLPIGSSLPVKDAKNESASATKPSHPLLRLAKEQPAAQ